MKISFIVVGLKLMFLSRVRAYDESKEVSPTEALCGESKGLFDLVVSVLESMYLSQLSQSKR